ncbi:hypothetical protein ACSLVK_05040 [Photorhabdus tasmaniensis]|uniref:RING-type domain-containing protein n=1 Tax=Photorhabdus tasmaniensis TaxID=1004159 RepID=A0ABX0GDX8_9GAMM|nr:hypothetical protein [Photorhabdus tasmaniensis]NHB86501.1 hypothetical protein [Photorhabdus tasmaniensis]
MPHIEPNTTKECTICLKNNDKPFYQLSCNHGSPESHPMHTECLKQVFQAEVDSNRVLGIADVTCPCCQQNPKLSDIEEIMRS